MPGDPASLFAPKVNDRCGEHGLHRDRIEHTTSRDGG